MTASSLAVASGSDLVDLLCFDIGAERFALHLADVEEVVDGVHVNTAQHPHSANGIIQLRDELIPVHSIDELLGAKRSTDEPFALILANDGNRVAVLVDYAEASQAVDMDALRDVPFLAEQDRLFIGAIRINARWVSLLDAEALVEMLIPASENSINSEEANVR